MNYVDHFNQSAEQYKLFRPSYPQALFDYLLTLVPSESHIWDCATGNAQAALFLAESFKVTATDISPAQLERAPRHESIDYIRCSAENTPIPAHSIDLVTVAQALHWFNLEAFYREVVRVTKPEGLIVAWCYSLGKIGNSKTLDDKINALITKLYNQILGDEYWPVQRHFIDEEYQTIPFPFQKMETPDFHIEKKMTFDDLIGYLNTWSAVKEYIVRNEENPVELIVDELMTAWGEPQAVHTMYWPLHLLAAKVTTYQG